MASGIIGTNSSITIILVHSDDLIITSNKMDTLDKTKKKQLLQTFDGVDQGDLTSFCGVEVDVQKDSISLSMGYYWDKLMQKFNIGPKDV
jgi:hypothetical protein